MFAFVIFNGILLALSLLVRKNCSKWKYVLFSVLYWVSLVFCALTTVFTISVEPVADLLSVAVDIVGLILLRSWRRAYQASHGEPIKESKWESKLASFLKSGDEDSRQKSKKILLWVIAAICILIGVCMGLSGNGNSHPGRRHTEFGRDPDGFMGYSEDFWDWMADQ